MWKGAQTNSRVFQHVPTIILDGDSSGVHFDVVIAVIGESENANDTDYHDIIMI